MFLETDINRTDSVRLLDLALLRSFVLVARGGSISHAAARAGRTQSALSMQMQRLEDQVGQPLLHRSGAGVGLTAAGERFLVHAEALLAMNDDVLAEMGGTTLRGTVTLGCPEDYSIAFLPELIKGFCATNPEVELTMVCAPTVELRPLLRRRRIDLALVSLHDSEDEATIRKESFAWVANSVKPELVDRPLVPLALSAPATLDYRAACAAMEAAGRRYRVAFASSSLAGLIAVARSGHAISVLTRTAVPPDLHIISTGLPPLPMIGIALEFSSRRSPAAVTALGRHIQATLPHL